MRQRLSWVAIGVLIIVIGYYAMLLFKKPSFEIINDSYNYTLPSENDTLFGNLFKSEVFNDSLPHYQYKKFKDSVDWVRINEKGMESKMFFSDFVGYAVKDFKANESIKQDLKNRTKVGSITYFVLYNYQFKDRETRYFEKDGKNYIAIPVVDGKMKNSNGGITTTFHYERKEVSFEYNKKEESIYFSVVSGWSTIMIGTFWTFVLLSVAVFLYIFIRLPILILTNISTGLAFDFQNIRYLKIIFKWLIGIAMAKTLLPIVLYLIFNKSIAAYFEPVSWFSIFSDFFGIYLSCLVVYLIKKAFEKGHKMQENEDLTV